MKTDEKKISLRAIIITLVIALAAFTLAYSSYHVTIAAINIYTDQDTSTLTFQSSGISLSLGSIDTASTNGLLLGHAYNCPVSAANNSSYDAYMRLIVTKYWTDKDGNRVLTVDPDTIQLTCGDGTVGSGWTLDANSVTAEQAIYYYGGIVPAGGGTGNLFDTVTVDPALADKVTTTTDGGVTTTTWDYGELTLHVEAEAQLVQAAGGTNAQLSAWGVALVG